MQLRAAMTSNVLNAGVIAAVDQQELSAVVNNVFRGSVSRHCRLVYNPYGECWVE